MAKKIFRSIILVSFAVLLTSIVLIMGVMYGYFTRISEGQLKTELEIASQGVAAGGTDYLAQISEQGRFTWIAADGTVIFDSAGTTENHADREEVVEALRSGEGSSYRYSSTLTEKTVYCAKRLSDGTVLRISSSYVTALSLAMGIVQPIAVTVIVAVILSALLSSRIAKKIVEPLKKLDLENPLENDSYEELAPVLGRLRVQQRQINAYIAELKQKKEEFDRISDSMSEGLIIVGKNDKIISINKAARRIFGCSDDPTGENFMTVEHSAEMNHAVETALLGKHSEFKKQIGGLEYQFDLSAIETDSEILGAVILAFDITDREFAERNRREFTANVSHELKTPLQSIIGSAELLENGMVKAEDASRFVSHIRTVAQRLLKHHLFDAVLTLHQRFGFADVKFVVVLLLGIAFDLDFGFKLHVSDARHRDAHAVINGVFAVRRDLIQLFKRDICFFQNGCNRFLRRFDCFFRPVCEDQDVCRSRCFRRLLIGRQTG